MRIQDILGLPLDTGLDFLSKQNISTNIVKTFSPINKGKEKETNNSNMPYIIRIKEIDSNLLELVISYF